jgi:hypothetical protein
VTSQGIVTSQGFNTYGNVLANGAFFGIGQSGGDIPPVNTVAGTAGAFRPVPFTDTLPLNNLVTVTGSDVTFPGNVSVNGNTYSQGSINSAGYISCNGAFYGLGQAITGPTGYRSVPFT